MRARVLIIDPEDQAEEVAAELTDEGFVVERARTGEEGLERIAQQAPDAVVLELALPDMDGLDVCGAVRQSLPAAIVVATRKTDEADRVCALELGADQVVSKPVRVAELVARLKALVRRSLGDGWWMPRGDVVDLGELRIDRARHEVTIRGRPVALTPKEFELLWVLASNAGRTMSSRRLLWEVWGYDENIRTRTLDVHIGRLRKKIERDPSAPELIVTVPGVGYRLELPGGQLRKAA